MTALDLGALALIAAAVCLYLGDGLNSIVAAVRELIEIQRKGKP